MTWHKKMTQKTEKVFIFLRNSPRSAITKAFTLDYFHKICIRVISRMGQHKWRRKCNDCFRNCVSGVLNFYDVLCIYFFIPRFKFTKFIYSSFHAWSKYKISVLYMLGLKKLQYVIQHVGKIGVLPCFFRFQVRLHNNPLTSLWFQCNARARIKIRVQNREK